MVEKHSRRTTGRRQRWVMVKSGTGLPVLLLGAEAESSRVCKVNVLHPWVWATYTGWPSILSIWEEFPTFSSRFHFPMSFKLLVASKTLFFKLLAILIYIYHMEKRYRNWEFLMFFKVSMNCWMLKKNISQILWTTLLQDSFISKRFFFFCFHIMRFVDSGPCLEEFLFHKN